MQTSIIEAYLEENISLSIVWIPMYGASDTQLAAAKSAHAIRDLRVRHFYDPEKQVGKAIAASLGAEGQIAWDIYHFYKPGDLWEGELPAPIGWTHQLTVCEWADAAHQHCGEKLIGELQRIMSTFARPAL